MPPNTKVQYLLQIIVSMWMATFSFMVIALTWALFYLQEPRDRKGPGINLKEL